MFSADSSFETILTCATRLYEQEAGKPEGFPLLGLYMWRWVTWTECGLGAYKKNPAGAGRFLVELSFSLPAICL